MRTTRFAVAAVTLALGMMAAGCDYTDLNSVELPGNAVSGSDAVHITVEMANVQNLVGNSEVKVDDVTVGTVRRIQLDGWHAKLTVYLRKDVELPANATAKLAQKSLLGSEYLQLGPPPGQQPVGRLRDGDVIPLSRTSRYPETEEVLSAVSLLLNGGGLEQIRTITGQLNDALDGRQDVVRSLIDRLNTFVGGLDSQKNDITRAIDSVDRLAGKLAEQKDTLVRATNAIPPALAVLDQQRGDLTTMLTSLSNLGSVATRVLTDSRQGLLNNLRSLQPVLTKLSDAGKDLPESLIVAGTIPFPVTTAANAFQGDYLNLFMTIDLTLPTIQDKLLKGMSLNSLLGLQAASQAQNPLLAPLAPPAQAPPPNTPAPAPSQTGGATPTPLPQSPQTQQPQTQQTQTTDPGLLGSLFGSLTGGSSR